METTKKLIKIGYDWLNENASPDVGFCNDRSCIRCRLADILIELEKHDPGFMLKEQNRILSEEVLKFKKENKKLENLLWEACVMIRESKYLDAGVLIEKEMGWACR